MWVGVNLWANDKMAISSFDIPIFNIKSGTMYIKWKDVINAKFLSQEHSQKKNYNRKRDFS